MSRSLAWVLGAGGLLGSHLIKSSRSRVGGIEAWNSGPSGIPWHDPSRAFSALDEQCEQFATRVLPGSRPWALIWCAGAGVVGTPAEALSIETSYLEQVLAHLDARLGSHPGKILLASSAGGVYGGNPEQPLTEDSCCIPISDYGRNKLLQESLLLDWARHHPGVSTLIARITNLYGPGQNIAKPQGLIAHISRSVIHNAPVHVYVPLDTLRDYLYVSDCALELLRGLDRLTLSPREDVLKIFHSGETVTIAGIIAAFNRIAKRHPRIVCSVASAQKLQPLRLQFRSTVWSDLQSQERTDLAVGIHRVHQHQLSLFQEGNLPAPPFMA